MAAPVWQVQGQYYETCNCDFVCPCVPAQLAVMPTKGTCLFAMAFQIEKGQYDSVPLDGLGFILLGSTPAEMGKGNWSVGVVVDERATADQRNAIAGIAIGPPAANTLSLARAESSHVSALGIVWDDTSGRNNGQYAPFSWQSA